MEISLDRDWHSALSDLEPREQSQVNAAVVRYEKSPDHPSLNLEQLRGRAGQKRLWTIRASQELRVLLARQGDVTVLLRAGHHDPIYRLAQQRTFVAPTAGAPGLMRITAESALDEDTEAPGGHAPASAKRPPTADSESILEQWGFSELAEAGFTESEIHKLREANQETLLHSGLARHRR